MSDIVLIVADEFRSLEHSLLTGLTREGFLVELAAGSGSLLGRLATLRPSVVLVDTGASAGAPGLDLCRQIRMHSSVPIIVMSDASSAIAPVAISSVGVDAQFTRPFRADDVIARIAASIRQSRLGKLDERAAAGTITVDGVSIDPDAHTVTVAGAAVQLSLKEFELLHVLMVNAGRAVRRAALIERIWGRDFVGDKKRLDVHVLRLRSKLERQGARPSLIVTVRGLGYRFEKPNHQDGEVSLSTCDAPTSVVSTAHTDSPSP